jgi:hypothetical protein
VIQLFILTEEISIKKLLNQIVPKLISEDVVHSIYQHQGKGDLKKAINGTVPTLSKIPNSRILILIDQDYSNCIELKKEIFELMKKKCNSPFLVRIVCHKLENWFLGDLKAIEKAFPRFHSSLHQDKKTFRSVDQIKEPHLKMLQIIPELEKKKFLPKIETAEKLAIHLDIGQNKSKSFQHFIRGVSKLIAD